ncbi:aminoglycoside phosphotransferase family protein [Arthrobacter sp. MW3 TE3886]|uniref:aminoglycoside phosphotransferase family protein n=1 Tax=Arthrobacter sp. MW3 TE3886 TaxID=3156254 RepID=UPI003512C64E
MTQVAMPAAARDRLIERFGPAAASWIDNFGTIVGELCEKWGMEPRAVCAGETGALVECVSTADGARYALKLSPDPTISEQEASALTYWANARTVVDLVDADANRGAILLHWLPDATELTEACSIAEVSSLISDLYTPNRTPPSNVPRARERVEFVFELWDRRRRALPNSPIDDAAWHRCHAAAIEMANDGDWLLHGDLHPGNILRTGNGGRIVAIDPRPCIGDPAMDLTDLAMSGATSEAAIRSRCRQLADIADPIDPDRLWLWCRNFAPIMAVSVARRAAGTANIIIMRTLASAR